MGTSAQANWDDLRFVLAVADQGSVASAARMLGVNHATVLRRIAAFETRHGMKVFEKTPTGYRVSPDRLALIEALRAASHAVGQVERLIDSHRPGVSTGIRITSTDAFCFFILPDIIAGLSEKISSPVSILSGNAHLDFGRLQADITVRPAVKLPEDLAGTRASSFRFGVFAAEGGQDTWLGLEGAIARSRGGEWVRRITGAGEPGLSSDSFIVLAGLAAAGRGKAILPLFVGDAWDGLHRVDVLDDIPPTPLWVASHVDLQESGRLKRARKYLADALAAQEGRLLGFDPPAAKSA
ncbi:MAG: LysR family transcriptional regulator [Silicimonas sp.]